MKLEYPCVHFEDGKCRKFSDEKTTSFCAIGPCEYQTLSNADHIRAMSDKELAEFICLLCSAETEIDGVVIPTQSEELIKCWLQSPCEGGEEDE